MITHAITLADLLTLSGILFALAVAGIFLNRKNVILLLMCVELLLLAANFNFIAFSRVMGDINGQVFVFFVLTRIHEYHMEHRGENVMSKDKLLAVGERYEAMIAADKGADAPYR